MKEKVFATLEKVRKHHLADLEQARKETEKETGDSPASYNELKLYLLMLFMELKIEFAKMLMEETHDA